MAAPEHFKTSSNAAPPLLSPFHHFCISQHHCFHLKTQAKRVAQGSARQALAAAVSDAAVPAACPVPSARGYQPEQAQQKGMQGSPSLASSQSVQRLIPKLLSSAVSAKVLGFAQSMCALPPGRGHSCLKTYSQICQDASVREEYQEHSANQT